MKYCEFCGADNTDEQVYCRRCRGKFPETSGSDSLMNKSIRKDDDVNRKFSAPTSAGSSAPAPAFPPQTPPAPSGVPSNTGAQKRKPIVPIILAAVLIVALVAAGVFVLPNLGGKKRDDHDGGSDPTQRSDSQQAVEASEDPDVSAAASSEEEKLGWRLVDDEHLLADSEHEALLSELNAMSQSCGFDIVILTTTELSENNADDYCRAYYYDNGFSVGDDRSGVLLVFNEEDPGSGLIYLDAYGECKRYLTDEGLQQILAYLDRACSLEETYRYFSTFVKLCGYFYRHAQEEAPFDDASPFVPDGVIFPAIPDEETPIVITDAVTLNGSELQSSNVNSARDFGAENIYDGDPESCWCVNTDAEGGAGAKIRIGLDSEHVLHGIRLVNGNQYQPYDELYSVNGQIHYFTLIFSDGTSIHLTADYNAGDPYASREFLFDHPVTSDSILLVVESGYVGTKYTTNVCLTEFEVF